MLADLHGLNLRNGRFLNQLLRLRMNVHIHSRLGHGRKQDYPHPSKSLLPSGGQEIILRRNRERRITIFLSARVGARRGREPQNGRRDPQRGHLRFGLETRLLRERFCRFDGIVPTGLKRIMYRLWRCRQWRDGDTFQLPVQKRDGG